MKRTMLLAIGLSLACQMRAGDYDSFLFQQSDGTKTVVATSQLKITFADGNLVATSSQGSATLPLSAMASMRFGSAEADAIAAVQPAESLADGSVCVYSMTGAKVAEGRDAQALMARLAPGLYLVRNGQTTQKICVR